MKKLKYLLLILLVCSCAKDVELPPVIENFESAKYLGKWYEIARYDNKFERGLNNVSSEYSKISDDIIKISNNAFSKYKQEWVTSKGIAKLNKEPNIGALKIRFFLPIYTDYRILYIDDNYETAIIGSSSINYLWVLSRTPQITDMKKGELLTLIDNMNYNSKNLIYPEHN